MMRDRNRAMNQTTPESVETFLTSLTLEGASEQTIRSYGLDLAHFARWFATSTAEAFSPAAITPTDIRDYRSHLLTVERRKPATIRRRLAALRKFSLWAIASGLATENPVNGVKGVASAPHSPKWLEKREIDKLLRACEQGGNSRDLAILMILRHTGIRVSELCSLTQQDITLGERSGELVVRSGKGAKYRVVPLNADARKALRAYLQDRPKTDTPALFVGLRGNGLTAQGVEKIVDKYAYKARLEGVTPHTLRHTAAKGLLDSGVNLVAVAALLGHQRLETTAIYTTPSQRDLEQAVSKLERDQLDLSSRS
jgi:site-specific recombinase XerD